LEIRFFLGKTYHDEHFIKKFKHVLVWQLKIEIEYIARYVLSKALNKKNPLPINDRG